MAACGIVRHGERREARARRLKALESRPLGVGVGRVEVWEEKGCGCSALMLDAERLSRKVRASSRRSWRWLSNETYSAADALASAETVSASSWDNVDLPLPLGPTSAQRSPWRSVRLRPEMRVRGGVPISTDLDRVASTRGPTELENRRITDRSLPFLNGGSHTRRRLPCGENGEECSPRRTRFCSIYPTGEVSPARAPPRAWEPPLTMTNEKVFHGYRGRDMYATSSHVHNQVYHKQASLPTSTLHRRRSVTAHVYTGNPPSRSRSRSATGRSLAIFGRPARSPGARPLHTQPVTAPPTSVGVCSHAMSRNSWKLPAAYQSRAATLRAFYHLHAATLRVFTR